MKDELKTNVIALEDGLTNEEKNKYMTFLCDGDYYGFSIAEGIPSKIYENVAIPEQSRTATSDTNFRTNKRLSGKVVSASKDVTVKLVFIKRTVSSTEILGERVIYKGDFEGGKNITLKGTLGKFASSATFNPTLGELTDGGVIPFN